MQIRNSSQIRKWARNFKKLKYSNKKTSEWGYGSSFKNKLTKSKTLGIALLKEKRDKSSFSIEAEFIRKNGSIELIGK